MMNPDELSRITLAAILDDPWLKGETSSREKVAKNLETGALKFRLRIGQKRPRSDSQNSNDLIKEYEKQRKLLKYDSKALSFSSIYTNVDPLDIWKSLEKHLSQQKVTENSRLVCTLNERVYRIEAEEKIINTNSESLKTS